MYRAAPFTPPLGPFFVNVSEEIVTRQVRVIGVQAASERCCNQKGEPFHIREASEAFLGPR